MELEFSGKIWQWRGPAPYYFVSLPERESDDLRVMAATLSYGWGGIRVAARVGETAWETSLMSKDGAYVLPLRDQVRQAEGLTHPGTVSVHLTTIPPKHQSNQRAAPGRPPLPRSEKAVAERARLSQEIANDRLTIEPANEADWNDLQAVFGDGGDRSRCWCQRYKMLPKESWASIGAETLADRLRQQSACGQPDSPTTSGLIAYLDGEPVGWCAVEPRPVYVRMLRNMRVPWEGRNESKSDDTVWAVTCFVTRPGFRRIGVSRALARAAVDFARHRGARALEGYPDLVEPGSNVGTRSIFAEAGLSEVSRPTTRRLVMRIDF